MFKLIKNLHSHAGAPELTVVKKNKQLKVYANSVYFIHGGNLTTDCNCDGMQAFIPIADTGTDTQDVTGYYVTPNMVFETDYIINGEEDESVVGDPVYFNSQYNRDNDSVIAQYVIREDGWYGGAYLLSKEDFEKTGKVQVVIRT